MELTQSKIILMDVFLKTILFTIKSVKFLLKLFKEKKKIKFSLSQVISSLFRTYCWQDHMHKRSNPQQIKERRKKINSYLLYKSIIFRQSKSYL